MAEKVHKKGNCWLIVLQIDSSSWQSQISIQIRMTIQRTHNRRFNIFIKSTNVDANFVISNKNTNRKMENRGGKIKARQDDGIRMENSSSQLPKYWNPENVGFKQQIKETLQFNAY